MDVKNLYKFHISNDILNVEKMNNKHTLLSPSSFSSSTEKRYIKLSLVRKQQAAFDIDATRCRIQQFVIHSGNATTVGFLHLTYSFQNPLFQISEVQNEHIELFKDEYKHLFNICFSDVCVSEDSLQIDELVGMDDLLDIQGDAILGGEPGDPVAIKTKLGWVSIRLS